MRFRVIAAAVLAFPLFSVAPAAPAPKIAPALAVRLEDGKVDSFIVLFDEPDQLNAAVARARALRGTRDLGHAVYDTLRQRARSAQAAVRAELDALGISYRSLYIINGLAVRGDLSLVRRLAAHGETVRILDDPPVRGVDVDLLAPWLSSPAAGVEWGVARIEADKVWNLDGKRGEGIVVASADTGVEWTHPALLGKYRGWNGSTASHDYNWFDPINDLASPIDDYGHGTHTTGTMVGDDGAGNQVGVAPGAKWIACRNMDHGVGRPSTYIACNQFFLAPYPHGGDPETDGDPSKAPDIVNNSWGCPPGDPPAGELCHISELLTSFSALRAAGILAVVSAGNSGSGCSSVDDPPAIYGESFVVGATDSNNVLAVFSSRGPVLIDGSGRMRPDVAAPGVAVRSSYPGSSYQSFQGTSMASPHVSGATALLWSAKPQLRGLVDLTRCLLTRSARSIVQLQTPQTCGGTSAANRPNNMFGYGLIDAYDAIHLGPDGDGDGIADACDCAPANGTAYLPPDEVLSLSIGADKTTLAWTAITSPSGGVVLYDAVRGDLSVLRATGVIAAAGCLASASTATSIADVQVPAPDTGQYYLVQARDACLGGFGTASSGNARTHATCP